MASLQAKLILKALSLRPFGWAKGSLEDQRAWMEKMTRALKISADIILSRLDADGVPAELIDVENSGNGVILYLHGGAYAVGSVKGHREYLARLARICGYKVLAIDYRLAPEHPFPAALEDAITAYRWLVSGGYDPSSIAIAGDSAGGGLAIATLVSLRNSGTPLPACAVCLSPWVNLATANETLNQHHDPILNAEILAHFAHAYAGQIDTHDPLISPIFADLKGLPPMLIHAGTNEILRDQITQFFEKARLSGVEVELELWEDLFHVFQMVPILPETKQSLKRVAEFITRKFSESDNPAAAI